MGKLSISLPDGLGPQTLNEYKSALRDALQWLQQHPSETPTTVAHRFDLLENNVRKALVGDL